MFKGVLTLRSYEQCLKRGLCESHMKELNQNELAVQQDELPRKAFLYIRVNILCTLLFKRTTKCPKIKILLQKTPVFARILANGSANEVADAILILDSVIVFTLCQLSKVCCIGALLQKNSATSEDPEIKHLQKLLYLDHIEGTVLPHLYPLLQSNFATFDLDLIKVSYVLTLLFVRSYCIKLNIKTTIETIEEDFKDGSCWENFKSMGDISYQNGNYKEALNAYTSAIMSNYFSSELFTLRAQTCLKLGLLTTAQLDAYIAVIIEPKCCEGYYAYSSSLFHQKLYEEAFNVAKYGLEACESNGSFYETLQTLCIEVEMKYLNKKESLKNISENLVNHCDSAEKPAPEKKYFPVLVDSDSADSESEASIKYVPELVEASDSDESEIVVYHLQEKKPVNMQAKNKTKKTPLEDSSDVQFTQLDMMNIYKCLKEASEAILLDCGYKAVQIFRGPLRAFTESPKLNTFEECEVVCIKYAYGIAYCKSGGYDDLLKCIAILKEIIEKYDSVTFPAAYYALGLAYRKLNSFKEALNYLEMVKSFLCKGIHFKVYSWPEVTTVIQETKAEILKVLVDDLIKECENPPNPDALCRFADCSYQPPIYYTDPDFKGYISLSCSEQCCLQYHLQCWKLMKTEKKLTDKEFLDLDCFTPDCEGNIIKIQSIDKKGDLAKEFTSDKKATKQKWAKWEKKIDVKEKKKKKANYRCEDGIQEVQCESVKDCSKRNTDANDKSSTVLISGYINPSVEKNASSENIQKSPQKVKVLELDVISERNEICSLSVSTVHGSLATVDKKVLDCPSKNKNEFTSAQEIPVVEILEKGSKCSKGREIPDVQVPEKKTECRNVEETTDIVSNFHHENQLTDAEIAQECTAKYLVSQCIKNHVYSYMSDFLQHHGPLRIDDPLLIDGMANFPEEVNNMIVKSGGIGEFLKDDLRFAFVGDIYICIVSDLATAYKMNSSSSMPADLETLQSLENPEHAKYYECSIDTQHQNFSLNPEALEYTPAIPSVDSKDADLKVNANNSSPKNIDTKNSSFEPVSCKHSSNFTNAISNSQKNKLKSCETLINNKFSNIPESIFSATAPSEQTEIYVNERKSTILSNENINKSELCFKVDNLDSNVKGVNNNRKSEEINTHLSARSNGESLCDIKEEIQCSSNSTSENTKIKIIQTQFLPVVKELCSDNFNNYLPYIDVCLKPYTIRKVSETATIGTETDFENAVDLIPAEHSRRLADALKAVNKQLADQNNSLKDQLESVTKEKQELFKEKQELLEEISKLKTSLSSSSFDIEVLKIDYKKKEEKLLNGRTYLLKSLTDAHSSIDELKKHIELLEAENSSLEETVDNLASSLNKAEEKIDVLQTEEKEHSDITKRLQKENSELKSRVNFAEIQFLKTKKSEYINRIEDKLLDAAVKEQELTRGLSMICRNINPMVQSSMKTIFAQLSSYTNELNALKLEYLKKFNEQIEKVGTGASLKELKQIELKTIPDLPHSQSLFPDLDKCLSNSTQMTFNLLNVGSMPQISATAPPATTTAAVIPPATCPPPLSFKPSANPSVSAMLQGKPSATIIPQASPSATIIPQASPSATIIPQASPSATIIPQASPSATIIPQASPSATIIPQASPSAAIIPPVPLSVLMSVMPILETNEKKTFDIVNTTEAFKNSGLSTNSFTSIPYSVPTLDKEFNKTCAIFSPPDVESNDKLNIPKVPPGIKNYATSSVSSRIASSSSKDSLETFPSGEKTFGGINIASKVNETGLSSLEQKKRTIAGSRTINSYDKLLGKLKEEFPSYSQEELISFVKEFRSQRRGKLTGLPIGTIINELSTMIKMKKSSEKKIHEQKVQPKSNKVLVNKKLVPDPKVPAVTEQPSVKKKSAWGNIDSDYKKPFSGNPEDDCIICSDPMTSTSAYKVSCGHSFHEQCIREWLNNKSNCPICRVLLLLPDEYPSL